MHDTEPKLEQRMPPLVVLGLTGPVGSGCSTLSRILDDPGALDSERGRPLIEALQRIGWVEVAKDGAIRIAWETLNQSVDDSYRKLSIAKDAEPRDRDEEKISLLEDEHHKLLEHREAIKALAKLPAYHSKEQHLFRTLSISDLIVSRALRAMERAGFTLDAVQDGEKRKKYDRFVKIARHHMNLQPAKKALEAAGVSTFADFYRRCYKKQDCTDLEKLGDNFYRVHGIACEIKHKYHKAHPFEYAEVMQDFGDNIRRWNNPFGTRDKESPEYACKLARGIAQAIHLLYDTSKGAFFVIDCLRNPYEVMYLRREFANFFLLSLFATKPTRCERVSIAARNRLGGELSETARKATIAAFERADTRDSGKGVKNEEALYRQNVTRCVAISDIAISNDAQWTKGGQIVIEELCKKSLRVLCLILSPGCTKPDSHEMFMNLAYTMAVKSNCISRQVGAVIVGRDGYVIGAGWNDTGEGRVSCGLRVVRDLQLDQFKAIAGSIKQDGEKSKDLISRIAKTVAPARNGDSGQQFCFCLKDILAEKQTKPALKNAFNDLLQLGGSGDGKSQGFWSEVQGLLHERLEDLADKAIEMTPLHQLEYCLALHAEENAILQSAKIGGMGLRGSTMYVTCQPCTLCAKKIQQVGISKVIYTQAYPKSMPDVYMAGIKHEQFEGVKPRGYVRLFMAHHDQKEWQYLESRGMVPEI